MWQKIRFFMLRVWHKKLPIYLLLAVIALWIIVPTGDPSDFLTIPIIAFLGIKITFIVIVVLLIIVLMNRKVRSLIWKKPTLSETIRCCRKITKTGKSFENCVINNG